MREVCFHSSEIREEHVSVWKNSGAFLYCLQCSACWSPDPLLTPSPLCRPICPSPWSAVWRRSRWGTKPWGPDSIPGVSCKVRSALTFNISFNAPFDEETLQWGRKPVSGTQTCFVIDTRWSIQQCLKWQKRPSWPEVCGCYLSLSH